MDSWLLKLAIAIVLIVAVALLFFDFGQKKQDRIGNWTSETFCELFLASGRAINRKPVPKSFARGRISVFVRRPNGTEDFLFDMIVDPNQLESAFKQLYEMPEEAREERRTGFMFVVANAEESEEPIQWPSGEPQDWYVGAEAAVRFLALEKERTQQAGE